MSKDTSTMHGSPDLQYRHISSEETTPGSSAQPSRPTSAGDHQPPPKRSRVRFNSTSEANDSTNKRSSFPLRDRSISPESHSTPKQVTTPKQVKSSPSHSRNSSVTNLLRRTPQEEEKDNPFVDPAIHPVFRPRASLLRNNSSSYAQELEKVDDLSEKTFSALAAQERAQRVATMLERHSAPSSRRNSLNNGAYSPDRGNNARASLISVDDIPLMPLDNRSPFIDGAGFESDEDEMEKRNESITSEAHKLVRAHTRKHNGEAWRIPAGPAPGLVSGQVTPDEEKADEYVARPQQYRGGVLSSLLKLYNAPPQGGASRRNSDTSESGIGSSGVTTPRSKSTKWYNHKSQSQDTLAGLIQASAILGAQGGVTTPKKGSRPVIGPSKQSGSTRLIESAVSTIRGRPRLEDEIRITVHIAETLSRQKYLLKLCRALMSYGAPTHRLEEYMKMSARVLEIDGQFLYIPGCMIISFDDVSTHTTEVKLVRTQQGVDLGKLKDVHEIYKEVVHDVIGVEEATQRLDNIITAKPKNHPWLLVIVYGFASATVAPFGKCIDIRWLNLTNNPQLLVAVLSTCPSPFFSAVSLAFSNSSSHHPPSSTATSSRSQPQSSHPSSPEHLALSVLQTQYSASPPWPNPPSPSSSPAIWFSAVL